MNRRRKLSVDPSWFSDPRRIRLIEALGSGYMADGLVLNLWHAFHVSGDRVNWTQNFKSEHAQLLHNLGLVSIDGDYFILEQKSVATQSEQPSLGKFFKEKWAARYGSDIPKWGVAQNSILKRWVGEVGFERAQKYIELYLSWNDPWVIRQGHPVEIMVTKTNAFVTDALKGREKLKEIKQHQDFVKEEIEESAHDRAERIYRNMEKRAELEAGSAVRKIQGPYSR